MDTQTLAPIEQRLDAIIRLLAAPLVQGKTIAEAAPTLSTLGLDNGLIAGLFGTSTTVVGTAIRRANSKGARKSRAKGAKR